MALYARLPRVLKEALYGPKYSKQMQRFRESVHPIGKTDLRLVPGFDGLSLQLNLGDRLGCDLYYGYFHEASDYALFMALVSPGDVVVDVGANFGMYSLGVAKRLSGEGRVIAVEPDDRSLALFRENARLNKLDERISFHQMCLGDYEGQAEFYATIEPSFSGLHDTGRSETAEKIVVQVSRLSTLLQSEHVSSVDKIKIDVEGAESLVLDGAIDLLENGDPIVMAELSSKNLDPGRSQKLGDTLKKLHDLGYVGLMIETASGTPSLIFTDFSGGLGILSTGDTNNYFLVKRSGKQFDRVQKTFDELARTGFSSGSSDSTLSRPNCSAEDLLWAGEIEIGVATEVQHKLHSKLSKMETSLNQSNYDLAMARRMNLVFEAKIGETEPIASQESRDRDGFLEEIGKALEAQMEENRAVKEALHRAMSELADRRMDNALFKEKLLKASAKLRVCTQEMAHLQNEAEQYRSIPGVVTRLMRLVNRGGTSG